MEHGSGPAWAAALEASALGVLMRDSAVLYPIANLAHILGLILLVGSMVVLDLRLLGWGRAVPVPSAKGLLTPIAIGGFVLLLISGTALFSADARPLWANPVVRIKAALVVAMVANAAFFNVAWRRRLARWDEDAPAAGRAQAALSLMGWLGVAACGRLIAYF
jgi:hypothetical protein